MSEILNVLKNYNFYSPIDTVEKLKGGSINTTYKIITSDGDKYILQKINENVFKDVDTLMNNIIAVTQKVKMEKIKKSLDKMHVLNIKFSVAGKSYHRGERGVYRLYDYMPYSETYDNVDCCDKVFEAGKAFGMFARLINSGSPITVNDTIKDFHNTALRLISLERAYQKCPISQKNKGEWVYNRLMERFGRINKITEKLQSIPKRIVHNDTKISNVAFSSITGKAIGVLDLDTVGNGYLAYDFGDGVRSIAGPKREDEGNLSAVLFDRERFNYFSDGYVCGVGDLLCEEELASLADGVYLITMELAVRFLTDYFQGDKYFKIDYEGQNLNRALCQTKLLLEVENNFDYIKNRLNRTRKGYNNG